MIDERKGYDEHGYYVRCEVCGLKFRPVNGMSASALWINHHEAEHARVDLNGSQGPSARRDSGGGAMREDPPKVDAVSLDAAGLGPFVAYMRLYTFHPVADVVKGNGQDVQEVAIDLEALYGMRQHIDNAIKSLEERKAVDFAVGDCERCHNVRMVNDPPKHMEGQRWLVHCPECGGRTAEYRSFKGYDRRSE